MFDDMINWLISLVYLVIHITSSYAIYKVDVM